MVRAIVAVLLLLNTAWPVTAQTPAVRKGDTVRLSPGAALPVSGLETLRVVGTEGDQIVIRRGIVSVNGKEVEGLTPGFLATLPPKGVEDTLRPGYVLVLFDGRGAGGPIRYWAVTSINALLTAGGRIVPAQ